MRSLLPLIVILALFALLFMGPMRRQKRLAAQARELRNQLEPGDQVLTTSGMYGTITAMDDESVTLEIAPGMPVRFAKAAIGQKVPDQDGYASGGGYAGSEHGADEHGADEHGAGGDYQDENEASASPPVADDLAAGEVASGRVRTIRGARPDGESSPESR